MSHLCATKVRPINRATKSELLKLELNEKRDYVLVGGFSSMYEVYRCKSCITSLSEFENNCNTFEGLMCEVSSISLNKNKAKTVQHKPNIRFI